MHLAAIRPSRLPVRNQTPLIARIPPLALNHPTPHRHSLFHQVGNAAAKPPSKKRQPTYHHRQPPAPASTKEKSSSAYFVALSGESCGRLQHLWVVLAYSRRPSCFLKHFTAPLPPVQAFSELTSTPKTVGGGHEHFIILEHHLSALPRPSYSRTYSPRSFEVYDSAAFTGMSASCEMNGSIYRIKIVCCA